MGKQRKRGGAVGPVSPGMSSTSLVLDQPLYDEKTGQPARTNVVVDGCRRVFTNVLAPNGLRLKPGFDAQPGSESVFYLLVGKGSTRAAAGDRQYHVFPLDPASQFWVACRLEFKDEQLRARLVGISLVFFQGFAFGSKQPLLRAEWDCVSHIKTSASAQPHWHVYQVPGEYSRERRPGLEEVSTLKSLDDTERSVVVPDTTDIGGSNFHLAMAARWHDSGVRSHQVPMTVDGVWSWIEGCVEYTRHQLLSG